MEISQNDLLKQLIDELTKLKPDFDKAQYLINAGADINAEPEDDYFNNVLENVILDYSLNRLCEFEDSCEKDCESNCIHLIGKDDLIDSTEIKIINFFINNGFDLKRKNCEVSASCLKAITLAINDHRIIEAAKILLDAGAEDVETEGESVLGFVGYEQMIAEIEVEDFKYANILEAYYQILDALEEKRNYKGIDYYGKAVGKKIIKVFATNENREDAIFNLDNPFSKHMNCYQETLYFQYEDGYLVSSQFADVWVDDEIKKDNVIEVSQHFSQIINHTITKIDVPNTSEDNFDPTLKVNIYFDNGVSVTLTTNKREHEQAGIFTAYFIIEARRY